MAGSSPRVWTSRIASTFLLLLLGIWLMTAIGCREAKVDRIKKANDSKTSPNAAPVDQLVATDLTLNEVIHRAESALNRFRRDVRDYQATLTKRERIGSSLSDTQSMSIKIQSRKYNHLVEPKASSSEPLKSTDGLHAYVRFTAQPSVAGREVIWIEGENDNQLIAHEAGMLNLMTLNLDPKGSLAMMGSKYPITEIGIERLLEKLIERGQKDLSMTPPQVTVTSNVKFDDRFCDRIRIVHPTKEQGFDFHIAEIWIDPVNEVPLYYASYDWPKKIGDTPALLEEYGYHDLQINVGLSDADFDPKNPKYKFP